MQITHKPSAHDREREREREREGSKKDNPNLQRKNMCVMHHLDYNSWKMQFETVCLCERWRGLATCYQLLAIKRLLKTQNM